MMGAKHLKMTKHKLHATKHRSPDEIRVWQYAFRMKYNVSTEEWEYADEIFS